MECLYVLFFLLAMSPSLSLKSADFSGETYRLVNDVQMTWARPMINKIKRQKHLSGDFLDIGCGTGEITGIIARAFPNSAIQGIDPNESMLEYGRKRCADLPNVRFTVASVPAFFDTTQPDTYGAILSFSMLHWLNLADLEKTMAGIYRALRPGGRCFFVLEGKASYNDCNFLREAINNVIQKGVWTGLFQAQNIRSFDDMLNPPTKTAFLKAVRKQHFTIEKVQLKPVPYVFKSPEGLKGWLDGSSPFKKQLGDKHAALVDAILAEYLKLCSPRANGALVYTENILYARLKKPTS